MIRLKAMTWSHPRGYDPLVACSDLWAAQGGAVIDWDKRSLQDFESYPVEDLARAYDLIVIDHPHVGQIADEGCLAPLDVPGREDQRQALMRGSVGQSYASYTWRGRQWAFPIDAATQVMATRPDRLPQAPATWAQVLDLARAGRVLLPLRPPHSLMCFYTLAANLGTPCRVEGDELIAAGAGAQVWDHLREIAALIDPACLAMDPIAVFEAMAEPAATAECAPLIYGYANYAVAGFRPRLLRFSDMPAVGAHGVTGSALGGTGIAVSAFAQDRQAATDFAYWIASGAVQRGPYAAAGGQPGHADAWEDDGVNAATGNFYRGTRATLEGAWVRPRHNGCMAFQEAASQAITGGLAEGAAAGGVIAGLNRLFRDSFRPA